MAPFAVGFEDDLACQGYRSATDHLYVMAQLSRWMGQREAGRGGPVGVGNRGLCRLEKGQRLCKPVSPVKLSRLVDYLVSVGAVARFEAAVAGTPVEVLIERYRFYLLQERAFQADSVRVYVDVARLFLSWLVADDDLDLEEMNATEVTRFVLAESQRLRVASARAMTTRLRSLLRFLYVQGLTACPLGDAVPSVASWRGRPPPAPLCRHPLARGWGEPRRDRPGIATSAQGHHLDLRESRPAVMSARGSRHPAGSRHPRGAWRTALDAAVGTALRTGIAELSVRQRAREHGGFLCVTD